MAKTRVPDRATIFTAAAAADQQSRLKNIINRLEATARQPQCVGSVKRMSLQFLYRAISLLLTCRIQGRRDIAAKYNIQMPSRKKFQPNRLRTKELCQ